MDIDIEPHGPGPASDNQNFTPDNAALPATDGHAHPSPARATTTKGDQDVIMSDSGLGTSKAGNQVSPQAITSNQGHGLSPYQPTVNRTQFTNPAGLSFIPPQPYGMSPYPSIEPFATSGSNATPPVPPGLTIRYAGNGVDVPNTHPDSSSAAYLYTPSHPNPYGYPPSLFSSGQPFPTASYKLSSPLDSFVPSYRYGSSPYTDLVSTHQPQALPEFTVGVTGGSHFVNYGPMAPQASNLQAKPIPELQPEPVQDDEVDKGDHLDLLPRINGAYRLLDLYSEQGSGGLVDKIIISQVSLKAFVNCLAPNAYKSVTKIDFSALDSVAIKPVGIYGSKSEIVHFFHEIGSIDDETAALLIVDQDENAHTKPHLRSGIYAVIPPTSDYEPSPIAYIVYWPEETTWNDNAAGSVRKNRVTFMRYLTRLADQVRALISDEHAQALVWKNAKDDESDDDLDGTSNDSDDEAVDSRFFKFEVAKTKEEEESAKLRDGFSIHHASFTSPLVDIPSNKGGTTSKPLYPQLLAGETRQAFMTSKLISERYEDVKHDGRYSDVRLQSQLRDYRSIILQDSVTREGLNILLENGGLRRRVPDLCRDFKERLEAIHDACNKERKAIVDKTTKEFSDNRQSLQKEIEAYVRQQVSDIFPMLDLNPEELNVPDGNDPLQYSHHLRAAYPEVEAAYNRTMKEKRPEFPKISPHGYKKAKQILLTVRHVAQRSHGLDHGRREDLIRRSLEDPSIMGADISSSSSKRSWSPLSILKKGAMALFGIGEDVLVKDDQVLDQSDPEFINSLPLVVTNESVYAEAVTKICVSARAALEDKIRKTSDLIVQRMEQAQSRECIAQGDRTARLRFEQAETEAYGDFRSAVKTSLIATPNAPALQISFVRKQGHHDFVELKAFSRRRLDAQMQHDVWPLDLTEDDKQKLREDPSHVPTPKVPRQPAVKFSIPLNWSIRHAQALGNLKYLIVTETPQNLGLSLFSASGGFTPSRPTKNIPAVQDRQHIVAVDEQTRTVALILTHPSKFEVQLFDMDETISNLHARGTPFNLTRWYDDGVPTLESACFFAGTNELCLTETSGRIRIFSFVSQNFRPATVQLVNKPAYIQSSADGAALLVVETNKERRPILRVLHYASFGSHTDGLAIPLPAAFTATTLISSTSIERRSNVYLMAITPQQVLETVAVDISKKETEYQFRAKGDAGQSSSRVHTIHNSLIDCFQEVWSRYPVVAAVKRETLSDENRLPRSITFVSELDKPPVGAYFKQLIRSFEQLSKKPTDRRLDKIAIEARSLGALDWDDPDASHLRSGEWLAELLCLIPIHIAVAKENRFIPLKDGVFDPALERELLGAQVSKIIDTISLGWYESIFSSYMASKPVKVISSMGEQSVGKSYSLNHIVDSSFAGSAVRTTEGVWLSVCPTKDCLVVALDFEGVHSIERTAQEDMLLVLFNTALSNLVLFRNNFALSRDVANMFTSFQASTQLFDPASNPKLFKGLLAIVIKDVVDGDKKEIVKEFTSKFSQIVSREQATNFITVLHDNQLTVIPWSVIQSREFYSLFSKVAKTLFKQPVTHGNAGEFLITMKTLMAKLKAQDWGSIDQTLIKHRAESLALMLPTALATGLGETHLTREALKNLDNQQEIGAAGDTSSVFYCGKDSSDVKTTLLGHLNDWKKDAARHDPDEISEHLQMIAEARIAHVKDWLQQNTARFPAENSDIRTLKREFDQQVDSLLANIQICLAECSSCRLRCVLNKSHSKSDHDCCTSHKCEDTCEYLEDHEGARVCGFLAGHSGRHICDASSHVCGTICDLHQKKGCQGVCIKPSDHIDDEHVCSARIHQCGEPCDLRDVQTAGGRFSCSNLCTLPFNEVHERHSCENVSTCPITCELCPRFCATGGHFHGLEPNQLHLCGQDHDCRQLCQAHGTCEVNTTPQSVETVFNGRHGTFQYTKYTQEAKRLQCEIEIPPGQREHAGPHRHSDDPDAFHFCEQSCPNCAYICHLPLGHSQEHETSHGSMTHTAWAIEGNADATVEIQGRKFAAQDGGAPQLCSSVCRDLGRHSHIDWCRNEKGPCQEPESEHITASMLPNRNRPKDWVSHKVFWARTGFKDPYSNNEQSEFGLCDVQCAGPEHEATATAPANPSFCILPIFHPPQPIDWHAVGNASYVSADGHSFGCPNPNSLRQAYHVIFVLDHSGSMSLSDRQPLPGQPVTRNIVARNNNRFGAVLSALYGFWISRSSGTAGGRRDSYSVILFDHRTENVIANDFTSTAEQLLNRLVVQNTDGGTNFDGALAAAQAAMETHWSPDRSPVVVFLSDGECNVSDPVIHDLCARAVALGKPLSFHAVSFGQSAYSNSLRRMVTVAEQIAQSAPRDPRTPQLVPCGYTDAIDTIRLAETFLNIADSLKKPRASLMRA